MFQAAEALLPIVLLVMLGAALRKGEFFDEAVRCGMDRFTFWVALPSLFIHELAGTNFRELVAGQLVLVLVLSALAGSVVAAMIAGLLRLPRTDFGVFVQAAFRGNLAFVGLPLLIFSLGGPGSSGPLVSSAVVALAALIPLYNVVSVLALMVSEHEWSWRVVPRILRGLGKNPLILSALVGSALGLLGLPLPSFVARPFELLGRTALALALVSMGGALIQLEVRGQLLLASLASALKVAVVPAVTWGLCVGLGLSSRDTLVALIFAACPTASASYIMTAQIGGNTALAATCVVVSTVMSLGTLAGVLILF